MSKFDKFKEMVEDDGTVIVILGLICLLVCAIVIAIVAAALLKALFPYIVGAVVLYGAYWLYQKTKK